MNLPANLTDDEILARVNNGEGNTSQLDRDIFKTGFFGIPNGNNVFTVVTFEVTGNKNIQRLTGITPGNVRGAGLGDLNHDGTIDAGDMSGTSHGFESVLYSRNDSFNPAADLNADGRVDHRDMFQLDEQLKAQGNASARAALKNVMRTIANYNNEFGTDAWDIDTLFDLIGMTGDIWRQDLNVDGQVSKADVDLLVRGVFDTEFGDANLDGRVDAADFVRLSNNFGRTGGWDSGDFNGDNLINAADFVILSNHFGFNAAIAPGDTQALAVFYATVVVPEPALLSLGLALAPLMLRRRNKVIHRKGESVSCR
jgi:hypothetical protein